MSRNLDVARKWRALIQRRREHLTVLYRSGRYKRYFTEEKLLAHMREAAKAAQEWDAVLAAAAPEPVVTLPRPAADSVVVRLPERGKAA